MLRHAVPLSVLDLAPVPGGADAAEALRRSTDLARRVEEWGYRRHWVAEHHNMPGIASSSPAVLIAHLAAATSTIRVGSGGVMLPNHVPLVVAEQFGMLAALHPGRIDLGIGRAPGTDQATAAALRRRADGLGDDDFLQELAQLVGLLHGAALESTSAASATSGSGQPGARITRGEVRAHPAAPQPPDVWLLGSSGYSAQVAALLGMPFAFAHHFAPHQTLTAIELYRNGFRPSARLEAPYLMLGAAVVCAPSEEEARWWHGSSALSMLRLRTGRPGPLPSPEEAASHPYSADERRVVDAATSSHVVGNPEAVAARLDELVTATGADELVVTTNVHDHAARLRSYELLAGMSAPATTGARSTQ